MGDAWGHPFVKQGQEVLWPPIVRIPEWRGRAGGVQWPVMPSKGDAGRCRGVYVAHKSDTARDASRRERNFLIGKSCESPRLKGVSFDKQCFSNHLPQRWARARAEQGNAAAGIGPMASRASCFPRMGKSGRRRIGRGQRLTYAKSQDGTYLFQDGEGNADEDRRKQQPMVPLLEAAAEHEHKGRGLVSNNTHSGVPRLTLCPRSWGAHERQFAVP